MAEKITLSMTVTQRDHAFLEKIAQKYGVSLAQVNRWILRDARKNQWRLRSK